MHKNPVAVQSRYSRVFSIKRRPTVDACRHRPWTVNEYTTAQRAADYQLTPSSTLKRRPYPPAGSVREQSRGVKVA
eukprot:822951-Prymnesium_polylepis.2